jgi:hypothetical protein
MYSNIPSTKMCRKSPIASREKAKRLADSLITRLLTTFRANPTSQQKAISYQRFVGLLAWIFAEEISQLELIKSVSEIRITEGNCYCR